MGSGELMTDSTGIALIVDALRGGETAFAEDNELAASTGTRLRGMRRMIAWSDRFSAQAAETAVRGGIRSVLFCGTGFQVAGEPPPHAAAAAAAPQARFGYPTRSQVVLTLRQLALDGDPRTAAFLASIARPSYLLRRAGVAGLGAPLQVQWGIGAWQLSAEDGAALAAAYGELLPRGSQLVLSAAELAAEVGALAGEKMHAHTPEVLAGWAARAGLHVVLEVPDVRAWGRDAWPESGFRRDRGAGRVSGLVAVKP